ncbi:hypothetical protein [Streptomyces lutosisoli]|uniref:Uncharacterized protein n=1 Tax=Streptomyces lutosisoli TaxID=2665721 RepID=A0ABW2W011_9ACTN
MRLVRGATGFWGGSDEPLAPTDMASFRSACFEAARGIGARVDELAFAGVSSFHAVTVAGRGASLVVLCHDHLPVVAFTDTPPVPGRPVARFVDPPAWAGSFGTVGYRVLHARDLSAPMTEVDLSELAKAELAQVRYWRPEVVGDLLFNWWD